MLIIIHNTVITWFTTVLKHELDKFTLVELKQFH